MKSSPGWCKKGFIVLALSAFSSVIPVRTAMAHEEAGKEKGANIEMKCTKTHGEGMSGLFIYRCENSEVICYGRSGSDSGLACKFK